MHNYAGLDFPDTRRICHPSRLMYHRSKDVKLLDNRALPTRQFDEVKFKANYLGAQLWDILPKDTQLSTSYCEFKNKIAKHVKAGMFKNLRL